MATDNTLPDQLSGYKNEIVPASSNRLPQQLSTAASRKNILNSLFLYEDTETINVRVLYESGSMSSKYTQSKQELAQYVDQIDGNESVKAVFVQLQVIDLPTLLKDISKCKGVKRHHIKRYRWFVVDVDTLREKKSTTNASEEEKSKSLAVAYALYAHLRNLGWPPAVFAIQRMAGICSGKSTWTAPLPTRR
jgi:hypothetical protein